MKTRKIFILVALVALTLAFGACNKSRYCHCVGEHYWTIDNTGDSVYLADTVVVNVDRSFKCAHILEMGVQELKNGVYVNTIRKFDCIELEDMDTVATIPPRPEPED